MRRKWRNEQVRAPSDNCRTVTCNSAVCQHYISLPLWSFSNSSTGRGGEIGDEEVEEARLEEGGVVAVVGGVVNGRLVLMPLCDWTD